MLGGVMVWMIAACSAASSKALLDTDKSSMRAATDSLTVYVVQHRDSMAASSYADNATFMPPNQPMVQGRAAIRAWMKSAQPLKSFVISPIDINGRGDLAYVRGTFQLLFENGAQDRGKFLEVRQRQKDGRWLIVADIFNSDLPPIAPVPAARR
jgi:ketosteroid isomerase-like protein